MERMQRMLGIDYGSKRVGLALSDPLGVIARPLHAVQNDKNLIEHLKSVASNENVQLYVVGMPLNLKGEHAQKSKEVEKFIEELRQASGIEVVTWDERFTTTIAQNTMRSMGVKKSVRQKRDGTIDSMAAAVMLQSFLDHAQHAR